MSEESLRHDREGINLRFVMRRKQDEKHEQEKLQTQAEEEEPKPAGYKVPRGADHQNLHSID